MRIIAGEYKGRKLVMPKAAKIRPTSDKVKEAMFQVLAKYVPGSDVLELFAGSGSLGIEALSRGASSVTFVEKDSRCIEVINKNLSFLPSTIHHPPSTVIHAKKGARHLFNREIAVKRCQAPFFTVFQDDAFAALKRFAREGRKFGIIIADPPYNRGYVKKLLNKLDKYDILTKPFFVIIERYADERPPANLSHLISLRDYKYTNKIISILKQRKQ